MDLSRERAGPSLPGHRGSSSFPRFALSRCLRLGAWGRRWRAPGDPPPPRATRPGSHLPAWVRASPGLGRLAGCRMVQAAAARRLLRFALQLQLCQFSGPRVLSATPQFCAGAVVRPLQFRIRVAGSLRNLVLGPEVGGRSFLLGALGRRKSCAGGRGAGGFLFPGSPWPGFRLGDGGFRVHAAPEAARMSAIPAEESDQLLIRPL